MQKRKEGKKREVNTNGQPLDTYRYLRKRLRELGIDLPYFAELMDFSTQQTIYDRLSGRTPWKIREIYQVMDIIKEPYERIPVVFPPDGVEYKQRGRPKRERQKSPKELLIEALGLMEAEEREETA